MRISCTQHTQDHDTTRCITVAYGDQKIWFPIDDVYNPETAILERLGIGERGADAIKALVDKLATL